ncbi:MAG: glyoxalase/bleomycin resistance/extradiol dioxygenase family protein [Acidobacteria bacterium]|nr:MAG: glyoxalase/bleomycin resistance/extradiol dioxygenase family protein [Acidobacteriota bacterium]
MFKGLRTVIYHVNDLDRAKAWYSSVLGLEPYFDQPFYVGFNVGGFELGLDPDMTGITGGTGSVSAYWGVSDCEAAVKRLLELGASSHSPVQDVGDSIRVASVIDPFGNVLGVIENPNFAIDATN